MKSVFVALCLLVAAVVAEPRERRFFIDKCSSSADCGANQCCIFNRYCFPRLPKYASCLLTSLHKCSCSDGLECRVTKEFDFLGQKIQLRQCMPTGESIRVEKLEDEEVKELTGQRQKRFLIDTIRCSTEADCGVDRCCLFNQICAKKLSKLSTCFFTNKHMCGCAKGLECRVTTTIVLPVVGTQIPIRQCVPPAGSDV